MKEPNLKPCPFCGGEPFEGHTGKLNYTIKCHECGITMEHDRKDKVQGEWNKREGKYPIEQEISAGKTKSKEEGYCIDRFNIPLNPLSGSLERIEIKVVEIGKISHTWLYLHGVRTFAKAGPVAIHLGRKEILESHANHDGWVRVEELKSIGYKKCLGCGEIVRMQYACPECNPMG